MAECIIDVQSVEGLPMTLKLSFGVTRKETERDGI